MKISLVNRFLKKPLAKIVLEFMDCIGRVRSNLHIKGSINQKEFNDAPLGSLPRIYHLDPQEHFVMSQEHHRGFHQ